MKKILRVIIIIGFCLIPGFCNAQRYDHIRINTKDCDFDTVIGDNIYFYRNNLSGRELTYQMPVVVYDGYKTGIIRCKAGWICFGIGGATVITGHVLKRTTNERCGNYLSAIGGSIFGVSVPLLIFGDHIKRESNMYNELFKEYDKKGN